MPFPELVGHLVYNLVFAAIFGFFAMRGDNDAENCLAETDLNTIVAAGPATESP